MLQQNGQILITAPVDARMDWQRLSKTCCVHCMAINRTGPSRPNWLYHTARAVGWCKRSDLQSSSSKFLCPLPRRCPFWNGTGLASCPYDASAGLVDSLHLLSNSAASSLPLRPAMHSPPDQPIDSVLSDQAKFLVQAFCVLV